MGGVITVVDYDRRWPSLFDALKSQYHEALAGIPVVGIEHVGSTSVRGLAAKPVIDIDIIVAAVHAQQAIDAMERSGFQSRGELGIPDRWAFRTPPDLPATNTYVVIDGSLPLRNHLAVRDMLPSETCSVAIQESAKNMQPSNGRSPQQSTTSTTTSRQSRNSCHRSSSEQG